MPHINKHMLSFFLTTKCNLNCSYCYTNKATHAHQSLSYDFAMLGIDKFLGGTGLSHIRFFGAGEPTEEFTLMKDICEYASAKLDGRLTIETQTNGAFSPEKARWLGENLDIVWISMDGLPHIQDHYRPTTSGGRSSRIIEENIRYLLTHGECIVGIRATVTNDNVREQREMIEYFADLGVNYVWSDPVFPSVGEPETSADIDLMLYAKEFVLASEYAASLGVVYRTFLGCNFDGFTRFHCRACRPAPHLTTDGYVSACDMALFGDDDNHMSAFIFGQWDRLNNEIVIDKKKVDLLRSRSVDNMPGCNTCEVRYLCGGYCLGETMNETGDLFGVKKQVCGPIKYLAATLPVAQRHYPFLHP